MPEQAYKRCKDCREEKSLDDFYPHPETRDGRLARCKTCHNARTSAHAQANRLLRNEQKRAWANRNPGAVKASRRATEERRRGALIEKAKRATERHPDKARARTAVMNAVARGGGELVRPASCDDCGRTNSPLRDGRASIQAHHPDYSKPLDVEWLCVACHNTRHADNPTDL